MSLKNPNGSNDFFIEMPEGAVYATQYDCVVDDQRIKAMFATHARDNFHPRCIICMSSSIDDLQRAWMEREAAISEQEQADAEDIVHLGRYGF